MVAKLKTAAWSMLAGAYYYSGLPHVRNRGQVAILTYHRVVSDDMVREERIQAGMYVRVQSSSLRSTIFENGLSSYP